MTRISLMVEFKKIQKYICLNLIESKNQLKNLFFVDKENSFNVLITVLDTNNYFTIKFIILIIN